LKNNIEKKKMIGAVVFKVERDGNHYISLYRDNVILACPTIGFSPVRLMVAFSIISGIKARQRDNCGDGQLSKHTCNTNVFRTKRF